MLNLDIAKKDNLVEIRFISENEIEVKPLQPLKSITSGQEAVFYLNDLCLGGGVIDKVYKEGKLLDC